MMLQLRRTCAVVQRVWLPQHAFRCVSTNASASVVTSSTGKCIQEMPLHRLAHQSRVHLEITDRTSTQIRILPTLSDFGLQVFARDSEITDGDVEVFSVQEEYSDSHSNPADAKDVKAIRIVKNEALGGYKGELPLILQLHLPHFVDLQISAIDAHVELDDKIEGNVKVVLSQGNVHVNKVRGEEITLTTKQGVITIKELVEGARVKLVANAVSCKRVMAGSTEIKLGKGIDDDMKTEIGAIYAATSTINSGSKGGIHVGNVHGYLRIAGEGMESVHVDSVNGALEIEDTSASCTVSAHFDSWSADASSSILVGGDVNISVDPTTPIDIELHGSQIQIAEGCEFDNSELDQLESDYAIFTGELKAKKTTHGDSTSGTSGKINVGMAKSAALRTSFFMNEAVTAGSSDNHPTTAHPAESPRLFVHSLGGQVQLEQLDWMAKLKRKHLKQH